MFCSKCGVEIQEGAGFCGNCGAAVNGEASLEKNFQAEKNAVRNSEIKALEDAYEYFGQKYGSYEAYGAANTLVEYYSLGAKKSLIVWGAIIFAIGLLTAGSSFAAGFFFFMLPGAAMIAGGILMQVNNKKKLAQFKQQSADLAYELTSYYSDYPNCPFGFEYSHPDDIELMLGMLRSGRADTIKESINTLLADQKEAEKTAYMRALESALESTREL